MLPVEDRQPPVGAFVRPRHRAHDVPPQRRGRDPHPSHPLRHARPAHPKPPRGQDQTGQITRCKTRAVHASATLRLPHGWQRRRTGV